MGDVEGHIGECITGQTSSVLVSMLIFVFLLDLLCWSGICSTRAFGRGRLCLVLVVSPVIRAGSAGPHIAQVLAHRAFVLRAQEFHFGRSGFHRHIPFWSSAGQASARLLPHAIGLPHRHVLLFAQDLLALLGGHGVEGVLALDTFHEPSGGGNLHRAVTE